MKVVQTNLFKNAIKKLHSNQKADLDKAVEAIMKSPDIGQSKTGDLSRVLVYKFKMVKTVNLAGLHLPRSNHYINDIDASGIGNA